MSIHLSLGASKIGARFASPYSKEHKSAALILGSIWGPHSRKPPKCWDDGAKGPSATQAENQPPPNNKGIHP